MTDARAAIARARASLEGLSVGDAFGERFFIAPEKALARVMARELPKGRWRWTDDTQMAISITEVLERHAAVEQDALASAFARRFREDRGYGRGAVRILSAVREGADWRVASSSAFGGRGSYGNGAAMRVAPLGAYFCEDLERCALEARRSAEVTHAHPEGQAGAIAVAVAAALAVHGRPLLEAVLEKTPPSETREGLARARGLPCTTHPLEVAAALGSGSQITAQDTVPFCVWMADRYAGRFEEAMWSTVAALGDRDTTCAIVGGILAAGGAPAPAPWRARREPLPSPPA